MSAPQAIGRLTRVTLSGRIADSLRRAVLSGEVPPGGQMNEAELAQRFGTSRGPLREAMQRLIQEGLLVSHPHRGVFVADLTEADLLDIYLARDAIEGAALRRIVPHPERAAVVDRLRQVVAAMARAVSASDWPGVADSDFVFHRTLVEAAGSPRLSRMFGTLQAETRLCLHMLMGGYRSRAELVDEHRRLAGFVRAGDLDAALAELTRHLGNPVEILRKGAAARGTVPSETKKP